MQSTEPVVSRPSTSGGMMLNGFSRPLFYNAPAATPAAAEKSAFVSQPSEAATESRKDNKENLKDNKEPARPRAGSGSLDTDEDSPREEGSAVVKSMQDVLDEKREQEVVFCLFTFSVFYLYFIIYFS